jgi:hypothetical protein
MGLPMIFNAGKCYLELTLVMKAGRCPHQLIPGKAPRGLKQIAVVRATASRPPRNIQRTLITQKANQLFLIFFLTTTGMRKRHSC